MKTRIRDILGAAIIVTSIISKLSINFIAIPLIVLWIIVTWVENPSDFCGYFLGRKKMVIFIYLWIITSFVLYLSRNIYMTDYEIKNIFRIAVNLLIFGYYYYLEDKNSIKFLYNISIITIIIYSILTVKELISNPYISRILATENYDISIIKNKFIGGYEFAYGLTFVLIPYIYIVFDSKLTHNFNKISNIVVIAVLLITILYQQYTISLLLLILGLVLNFLKVKKLRSLIIWTIIILIVVVSLSNVIVKLLDIISKNINQVAISERINELAIAMKNKNTSNTVDFQERIRRYNMSMEEIVKDPLAFNTNKQFGEHSEILDEYAKYGIIIASITVLPFYQYIKFINSKLASKEKKRIWFSISIVYILFNIINNTMFIATSLMIFFVTPSVIYLSKERKKENEDSLDS